MSWSRRRRWRWRARRAPAAAVARASGLGRTVTPSTTSAREARAAFGVDELDLRRLAAGGQRRHSSAAAACRRASAATSRATPTCPSAVGAIRRHVDLPDLVGQTRLSAVVAGSSPSSGDETTMPACDLPRPSSSSAHSMPGDTMPRTGFAPSASRIRQLRAGPRPQHLAARRRARWARRTRPASSCRCRRRRRRASAWRRRDAAAWRRPARPRRRRSPRTASRPSISKPASVSARATSSTSSAVALDELSAARFTRHLHRNCRAKRTSPSKNA